MGSFELLTEFDVQYAPSAIKKWRSKCTGLQAAVVSKETPLVNGFFAVATEVADDSGTPHTLEHLIFMGSQKYPYKGLLDTLGNVMFSNTNAWTATDQTVYTLTTAGWDGFKTLLPVYLDHVLNPTLTDEGCYTEVYHVDGEGKEKGVVFSEMHGIENQPWFLTALESQRTMFDPKSGYSSETGGLTENLRVLSNDTIRKFHEASYRPSNLCVIVNGTVDEDEFLKVMEEFDATLPDLAEHKRPFVDSEAQIVRLPKEIVREIEFPEKDESYGEISISWVGPKHDLYEEDLAITLLLEYLCESPIALLSKKMVENDDPWASAIEYSTDDYTYIIPYIKLNDVPTGKLSTAKHEAFKLLNEHARVEEFDLQRMREIVENSKNKLLLSTEKSADILTDYVINDFLYSDVQGKALTKNLQSLHDYETISNWSVEQWVELFQTYLVNNNAAVIVSKPSKALYKSLKASKKKLLEDRKSELGEEGLQKLKDKLQAAQDKNDAPIPQKILDSFTKPDPAKIHFINTTTIGVGLNKDVENDLSNPFVNQIVGNTPKDFPLYINIDQFKSEFISIDILMSSFEIPEHLLPYFEIFSEIFSLPLEIDGKMIPYEQVVKDLENDTVEYSIYNGFQNQFSEVIATHIQVKKANYHKAIEWFKKIFWNTKFDEKRVKVAIDKFLNSLPGYKRSGISLLGSIYSKYALTNRSLKRSKDSIIVEEFYRDISKKLSNGEYRTIESHLEEIRSVLFKPSNFRIIIAGDLSTVPDPIKSWNKFIPDHLNTSLDPSQLIPVPRTFDVRTELGQNFSKKAYIITAPASESSFLIAVTKIPTDYNFKDMAGIALASSYLQAVEGPFWRGIRGTGLAYGANVSRSVEAGQLNFDVYRGADAIKSFEVAKKIVEDLASGEVKVDKSLFEGAFSSLVNTLASTESDYYSAAAAKYMDNVLKKRGPEFNTKFINELKEVTEKDMIRIIQEYFVKIYNSDTSAVFVCCHPSNANDLKQFFTAQDYEVSVEEVSQQEGDDEDDEDENEDEDGEDGDEDDESDYSSEEEETDDE